MCFCLWHQNVCYLCKKLKVKCTIARTLRLCTGRTAHRGSRGIALLFLDHATRRGWGVSVMPRPLFIPGNDPVPIVQEDGWDPVPVWTCAENLAPTGIRSPDRPTRSQPLYRLSYPVQNLCAVITLIASCDRKRHNVRIFVTNNDNSLHIMVFVFWFCESWFGKVKQETMSDLFISTNPITRFGWKRNKQTARMQFHRAMREFVCTSVCIWTHI